jgi:hypothetical protein
VTALDDLRALARARALVDQQVGELVVQALRDGSDRGAVAAVLGVSRSSLYREFGDQIRQDQSEGSDR